MAVVNIRNLDPRVWHQFILASRQRGVPAGRLLTGVLQEWLRGSAAAPSREQRAARSAGRWAGRQVERRLVDELLTERRVEAATEDAR